MGDFVREFLIVGLINAIVRDRLRMNPRPLLKQLYPTIGDEGISRGFAAERVARGLERA